MVQQKQPSLKNLTAQDYGRPPPKQLQELQDLTKQHIESFNFVLREGLQKAVKNVPLVEFELPNGSRVSLSIRDACINSPMINVGPKGVVAVDLYPAECRESGTTYGGQLQVSIIWQVDGKTFGPEHRNIGMVPVMVKSNLCNLHGLSPQELIRRGEEAEEMGGYFVVNGNEKVIRMLTVPRRNHPTCLSRHGWTGRGKLYTEYGVTMRCVKDDLTASNIVLHYLNNGSANLCFTYRKEQFFVPVILIMKALVNVTDQHIFKELTKGKDDSFFKGCVANMLRLAQEEKLSKQDNICRYIGQRFRVKVNLPPWYTDQQITDFLLKECVCIHLNNNMDKFNLLVYMTRKLFAHAKGECAAESPDNPMFQEVLLGGHLYLMTLKEILYDSLQYLRVYIERMAKTKGADFKFESVMMVSAMRRVGDTAKRLTNLLSSGNLTSSSGLGLMQNSGLAVVADKLNFVRFLSHFRAVHRGAFFTQMRTTAVRKLLPEAWGFLCPVHTPDGTPCGLLNHLSASCEVVCKTYFVKGLHQLLIQLGMEPLSADLTFPSSEYYSVLLDGLVIGWIHHSSARSAAEQLRVFKVTGKHQVPSVLEICLVERTEVASQYPGFYLFTGLARLVRPVKNLALNMTEYIGTFEQVYLNICIIPEEAHSGRTTHMELSETSILSSVASLTPFSDFNQSPRNMYQCQMGKQTMGTPLHAFGHRADSKLYRIQTPQSPMVRPVAYDSYEMDNYPLGTNAVVAVISYTGYDMEDAMIINKSSCERGFGHGSIYKSYFINLKEISKERGCSPFVFGVKPGDPASDELENDGLPPVGKYLTEGCPFYSFLDTQTGVMKVMKYKDMEPAYVDQIKILGNEKGMEPLTNVCFILRQVRNPIIGDKFASRHGQKGICSLLWPTEDMPFSESGMTPDIIFNPHGFPSRMTIGMMIESMAGKSAAMHGIPHDATPFTFSEDSPAIDHFGNLLTEAGYDYFGTEKMYSGVDGREFEADIFIGIVYYQRLRHMVSDKFQVRTTGIVDKVTRQPMKGRKRAGGIRFGEMERDGLLSHGTPFLLKDRLLNCSDKSKAHVCTKCGSILSTMCEPVNNWTFQGQWFCKTCNTKENVKVVIVPHVFKYLVAELAAMSVKVSLDVRDISA